MGLLSNKIDREVLKPGDHIYSWRNAYLYGHHGLSLYLSLFFAFSCCVIGVLDAHWDQFCKENDALACFLVSLFVFGILDQCGYPFGFRFVKQLMFWCAFRMPIWFLIGFWHFESRINSLWMQRWGLSDWVMGIKWVDLGLYVQLSWWVVIITLN